MSELSSGLATGLFLLFAMLPLAVIAPLGRNSQLRARIGAVMTATIIGVAFLQTGLWRSNSLASTDVADLLPVQPFANRCDQTFDILRQAGVILAAPTPDGLVVRGALWDQVPQTVQETVQACAATLTAPDAQQIPLIRR